MAPVTSRQYRDEDLWNVEMLHTGMLKKRANDGKVEIISCNYSRESKT